MVSFTIILKAQCTLYSKQWFSNFLTFDSIIVTKYFLRPRLTLIAIKNQKQKRAELLDALMYHYEPIIVLIE